MDTNFLKNKFTGQSDQIDLHCKDFEGIIGYIPSLGISIATQFIPSKAQWKMTPGRDFPYLLDPNMSFCNIRQNHKSTFNIQRKIGM
jgi:hypothetical protein